MTGETCIQTAVGDFDLALHAGTWWVEEKLDGWRLLASPGRACLRNGKNVWDRLPAEMQKQIRSVLAGRPDNSALDGELLALDGDYERILPAAAVAAALAGHGPELIFVPFALVGGPLDPQENWELLNASPLGAPETRGWVTLRTAEDVQALLDLAVEHRIEGWVPKNANGDWLRLKPRRTADLIVLGLLPGKGALTGKVGSLAVGVRDATGALFEVARVNGLDDATRAALSPADVGRVCEVAYQGVNESGRLRFPRFKRWRDDKPAGQATTTGELR